MKKVKKYIILPLLFVTLFNLLICSSTLLMHEMGHFFLGMGMGCKGIKLVLLDSELGTYTEMNCPKEHSIFFPVAGAFVLVLPFLFLFLLFKDFLEKNLFWIGVGFNFTIAMVDFPFTILQFLSFFFGLCLIIYGEILLIDKLLSIMK
ncbi:MAG: hypothetical protein QW040_00025 [Candidatus Aenigmatarchaeota archaeon]